MIRRILIAGLAVSAHTAVANAQNDCKPIHFPARQSSITIHGVAPPDDSQEVSCYTFAAAAGQTARATVNNHMIMSISDVGDDRPIMIFRTKAQTYKIIVASEGRSATRDPYTLTLSIR